MMKMTGLLNRLLAVIPEKKHTGIYSNYSYQQD